jgi:threonine synthase
VSEKYRLECVVCGWSGSPEPRFRCPSCGGLIEAQINLDAADVLPTTEPELTYFDLLPLESEDLLEPGTSTATPCLPATRLGPALGLSQLWMKDESRQPTGSTKDRLASVVLAVFLQFGIAEFVCASTGNTAIALARATARSGRMRGYFFCGTGSSGCELIDQSGGNSLTVVDGSYGDAIAASKAFAREHGILAEDGFFNWARREGLKLAYLEAFDEMPVAPDVVVQAISSGMGVMAARKAAREYLDLGRLARLPRFLMVQQDTCAPMADAWRDGRSELTGDDVVVNPCGLATAILLGDARASYGYMRDLAETSDGAILAVSQADLVEARQMLLGLEGLDVCYSAAAAVAAVRNEAASGRIGRDDVVLVNLTGRPRGSAS